MNQEESARTRLLLGDGALMRLARARVALFGVGGVGGHCAEALARAGIGALDLYDNDVVSPSNLNRQLAALHSTLGQPKAQVMARRILDINPDCQVRAIELFYLPENADSVDLSAYDYVVDAIDTVSAKLELAQRCHALGVPLISCMGSGNKLDPSGFRVTDLYKTQGCPLARVMRKELRRRGVPALKVVFSPEEPRPTGVRTPGSVSFVPGAAGLVLAGAVVRALAEGPGKKDC
jgi:tRNA A37 threonylcarbamoyladenosine dehydratase